MTEPAPLPPRMAKTDGIELCYDIFGRDDAEPIVLIMGLGAQMIHWDDEFCADLAQRGFRVIRFDNRDIGQSTKMSGGKKLSALELLKLRFLKIPVDAPYRLSDMAKDTVGLMDALGIQSAHIVGASMGGMIAQEIAITYPQRVKSLTSIMSTTGNPAVGQATPEAMAVLTQRPTSNDVAAIVAHGVRAEKVIGSPGYPVSEADLSARIRRDFERSFYPAGIARQMAAIVGSGDRRAALRKITAPTMVIHGVDDPLVPIAGGRDTAATIPGARIVEIAGMGHNLPEPLIPQVLDAFEEVARTKEASLR